MRARGRAAAVNLRVTLAPRAAARLETLRESANNPHAKLRLSVDGGGCSGFQYIFALDRDDVAEDDLVDSTGSLVVDSTSHELVSGATVDYTQDLIRESFEVTANPNAEDACGCGSSFAKKKFAEAEELY